MTVEQFATNPPLYYETHGIDINGLGSQDIDRIGEVGLWAWMDETAAAQKAEKAARVLAAATKLCALKSRCLKAKSRRAAPVPGNGLYCSQLCRDRAKILARKQTDADRATYLASGGQIEPDMPISEQ